MNVLLIDDEPNCLEMLEILIKKYCPNLHIIGQYEDPSVAVNKIPILKPDLVFLDVDMPILNGFDVLDKCRDTPFPVIFTTAHNQYAVKAFKYSAIDYLLKPIDKEELITAVQKAKHIHQINYQAQQRNILLDYVNPLKATKQKIALSTSDSIVFLNIKDIVYCESHGNYSNVFTQDGKSHTFTKSLKDLEEMLQENLFFRVHNSYLVNLRKVEKYLRTDGGDVKMSDGKIIPVARSKKEELLGALSKL
jgi:two-component system, LytTR family, response regulator